MVAGPSILLGLWAAASVAAAPAVSPVPPPDSLVSLAQQVRKHDVIVWSGAHKYRLGKARFDSSGVWSADDATYRAPRQAVIVTDAAPPGRQTLPKPIPWVDVDSIATVKDPNGPVVVLALLCAAVAVVGLIAGGIELASHTSEHSNGAVITSMVVPAVLSIALMSSAAAHTHTRVVYRPGWP